MVKLRHKPISNQRSIIPRSTPSMEGGTETALTTIRVDQGSEFISRDLDIWAYQKGVVLDFSRPPGKRENRRTTASSNLSTASSEASA
ncbi:transposase InsO family protein [Bradyrhizobium sp. F1.13.4]